MAGTITMFFNAHRREILSNQHDLLFISLLWTIIWFVFGQESPYEISHSFSPLINDLHPDVKLKTL